MASENTTASTKAKTVITTLLLILTIASAVFLAGCETQTKEEADFAGIKSIAELSTLKAYYHNVAVGEKEAEGPFAGILKTGYKRLWIEYSGTVDIGIDVNSVKISKPDEQGVVKAYVPDVQVLGANLDKDSVADPISETGFMTKVDGEEKMKAIAAAQETMEEQASQDQSLFTQAYDRAKRVIKGYIENVGAAIGEKYTVEWVADETAIE